MNKQIEEWIEEAGFVRFSKREDPLQPIDWSCDYTQELDRLIKIIVRDCAEGAYEFLDDPFLSGFGYATNTHQHIMDFLK